MPRHDFLCEGCGHSWEEIVPAGLVTQTICPGCNSSEFVEPIYINWKAVQAIMDMEPYFDNGLGKYVKGRSDRAEKMKVLGLEEAGDGSEQKKRDDMMEEARAKKRERRKSDGG